MTIEQTAAAIRASKTYAAVRAVDDPAKLARAARIVRAALVRQRLTIDDLTGADIADPLPADPREAA